MKRFTHPHTSATGPGLVQAMPALAPLAMPEQDLGPACVNHRRPAIDWILSQPLTR